jgi:hypothetical protein
MKLKEFSVAVPGRGSVDVSFYLHFDGRNTSVGEIKIHSDYDSGLPHRAWLKQDNAIWYLYDDRPIIEGSEVKVVPEYLNNDVSNEIVAKILDIVEQES